MNWSLDEVALVPAALVTVISYAPKIPFVAGRVAVIWVSESTVKLLAFPELGPLSLTAVAPVKPVPVMTTLVVV